jgi:hypothetical protein
MHRARAWIKAAGREVNRCFHETSVVRGAALLPRDRSFAVNEFTQ